MISRSFANKMRVAIREKSAGLLNKAGTTFQHRPGFSIALLLGVGMAWGGGIGFAANTQLRAEVFQYQVQLEHAQENSQREINALAARLGELQAQANRLNALGERLTRIGQLHDGEFDFDRPVAVGGDGEIEDMPREGLQQGMASLDAQFKASGDQLSVLETILFHQGLTIDSIPSGLPIDSYITSNFGERANPTRGGRQFHKGIDFEADLGDPVVAVADGVVSFSGPRSAYGNVIEIDHGNGYMTRYAHNSKLTLKAGSLVRSGDEIAKAGSTGRSTGVHVHFEVWKNGAVVNPHHFLRQRSPLIG